MAKTFKCCKCGRKIEFSLGGTCEYCGANYLEKENKLAAKRAVKRGVEVDWDIVKGEVR